MKVNFDKKDDIWVFIQARYNSTRLKGKVLKKINGKILLQWIVERAKKIDPSVNVAILTGDNPENIKIIEWCKKNNLNCFDGSENDVLNRFSLATRHYAAKTIIRFTGDNPLIDYSMAKTLLTAHLQAKADYSSSKSEYGSRLPVGIGIEIFTDNLIYKLDKMKLNPSHREHINDYILENPDQFRCICLGIGQDFTKISFTIDTLKDFERVQKMFSNCSPENLIKADCWSYLTS